MKNQKNKYEGNWSINHGQISGQYIESNNKAALAKALRAIALGNLPCGVGNVARWNIYLIDQDMSVDNEPVLSGQYRG